MPSILPPADLSVARPCGGAARQPAQRTGRAGQTLSAYQTCRTVRRILMAVPALRDHADDGQQHHQQVPEPVVLDGIGERAPREVGGVERAHQQHQAADDTHGTRDRAQEDEDEHRHAAEGRDQSEHQADRDAHEDGEPVPVDAEGDDKARADREAEGTEGEHDGDGVVEVGEDREDHGEDQAEDPARDGPEEALVRPRRDDAGAEGEPGEEAPDGQGDPQHELAREEHEGAGQDRQHVPG